MREFIYLQILTRSRHLARLKKALLFVKITLLMLVFSVGMSFANDNSYADEASLSLKMSGATVAKILDAIEQQTEFQFYYNSKLVDTDRETSIDVKNADVFTTLDKLFAGSNVSYRVIDRDIILTVKEASPSAVKKANEKTVTGLVTDEDRESLVGVSVSVKGTTIGTVTDFEGKYTLLNIPDNAVLVFSYLGMEKEEISVGNNSVINVRMRNAAFSLNEVVTIGYTTSKRRDMVGSVAKITSDVISTPAYGNIAAALQGKASGVYVTGGDIRIRGMNSISLSTAPMWIIDGVPGDHNNLNPNDIESVTILKDASATAMYGSSGANGVIVVTTKSHAGQKTAITVELDAGTSNYMGTGWEMMDSRSLIEAYDLALANTAKYTGGTLLQYNPQLGYNWDASITSNYHLTREQHLNINHRGIKEYTRNAPYGQVYLNANKSFDGGNAAVSFTYRDSDGIVYDTSSKRYLTRVVFNFSPTKSFHISFNSINQFSTANNEGAGSVLMRPPYMPIYDVWDIGPTGYWGPGQNPIIRGDSKYHQDRNKSFGSTNYLKLDLDIPYIQGLKIGAVGQAGVSGNRRTEWWGKELRSYSNQEIARADEESGFGYSYMTRGEISYNRTFGDHTIGAIGWIEGRKSFGVPLRATGYNLNNSYPMLGNPGNFTSMESNRSESGSAAYMGRLTYNFRSKYFLEGVIRREGLSNLSSANRWATFPSVGASWILSEESFWTVEPINLLKLRGSIGKSGNANVPQFVYMPGFQYRSRAGDTYEDYQITRIISLAANVQWETSDNRDVGIDFGLLDNRINGSIAYFNKETSGLLLQVPLPPSAGIFQSNSVWANIGNMRNTGFEFNVDAALMNRGKFTWNTSFNFTTVKNEVLSLHPQVDQTGSGIFASASRVLTRAGGKLANYFMAEYAGIDKERGIPMIYERDAKIFAESGKTVKTGNLIPASMSNCQGNQMYMDGKSYIPSFFGGWRNSFRFGDWDLNLMLSYTGGHYYIDQVEWRLQYVRVGQFNLVSDRVENAWKKPGDDAKYMEMIYNGGFYYSNAGVKQTALNSLSNDYPTTSNFLKRGDNIQLKEVTLGYTLPRTLINKSGMDHARVFLNINNAWYWAIDQKNGNPDVGLGTQTSGGVQNNVQGVERWEGFMARTVSVGLSAKF